jgi:hypothetical protein
MDWSSVESADDSLEVQSPTAYRCQFYLPGHAVHWIHWKYLRKNPSSPVAKLTLRRGFLEVTFAKQIAPLLWWNHDLDRLITALRGSDEDDLDAWPQWNAIRVGRAYFNCSDAATACSRPGLWEGI